MESLLASTAALLLAAAPAAATAAGGPAATGRPVFASAPVCPGPAAEGEARCHSHVRLDVDARPFATTGPTGYGPADLRAAYVLPSATAGAGQVVAIVDAYDDPNVESDLGVYRAQFGLPILSTHPSEWRRLKKAHRRAAATSRTFDAERAVLAAHRLEVRRLQKREAPGKRRAA